MDVFHPKWTVMCVLETCHISCELRSDQVVHFLTDIHTQTLDTVSPHNKEMHFWLFKATYIVGFGFVFVCNSYYLRVGVRNII